MALHNFPVQPTPFIGRDREMAQLATLLENPDCRLLTLVGPGGMGKTRLVIEAGQAQEAHFADGVYFVPLQPLSSSEDILGAIAQVLGIRFSASFAPQQQLFDWLYKRSLLLVLDNLEHLLDGVDLLTECLNAAPGLRILTTSRERLNLLEEWVFDVGGLEVPTTQDHHDVTDYSAIALFVQGAQRVDRSFSLSNEQAHVVRICQLVDGMPLALELASAWVRALPTAEIVQELESSLDILETAARNVLPRHRNIRAVMQTSWALLSDEERRIFASLAVFRGGFTRAAAEAITGASRRTLAGLVDKSWLRYSSDTGRYDIQELLRQFAEEQLSATPAAETNARHQHAIYYMQLLREVWPRMTGAEFAEASAEVETDLDNVRSAWVWAVYEDHFELLEGALQGLWFYYDRGSRFQEGEQVFGKAAGRLAQAGAAYHGLYGSVLARQAALNFSLDLFQKSRQLALQAVDVLRPTDQRDGLAFALLILGILEIEEHANSETATPLLTESLSMYRALGDRWSTAYNLSWLDVATIITSDKGHGYDANAVYEQACDYAYEAMAIFESLGNAWGIAMMTMHRSMLAFFVDDFKAAWQYAHDGYKIFESIGVHWGRAYASQNMADASFFLGDYTATRRHIAQSLSIAMQYRLVKYTLLSLYLLAEIEIAEGCKNRGLEILAFVEEQRRRYNHPRYVSFDFDPLLKEGMQSALRPRLDQARTTHMDVFIPQVMEWLEAEAAQENANAEPAPAAVQTLADPLTEREMDVLALLAQGLSNRQIADALVLALGTVKTHVHNICGKLDAANRREALDHAREIGLI
jgi:predicted ATPase/DNA-binding CsgD family transcriptional regulator